MADDHITPTANILGTIGTVLWCMQLLPQIWKNYRTKSTEGLGAMMLIWAFSGVPMAIYAIIQKLNIPIQAQAIIFTALSLVTWGQCLLYHHKLSVWKSIVLPLLLGTVFACIEVGVVLGFGPSHDAGNEGPTMAIGIIAAVLLAGGLLPPYWEIWKRRGEVIGISYRMLSIDSLGGIFSLLSLFAQKGEFDVVAGVQFCVVVFLESGIMVLGAIWKLRCYLRGRKEKDVEGQSEVVQGVKLLLSTYISSVLCIALNPMLHMCFHDASELSILFVRVE
ncbi:hypothetical protein BJ508DRAFT_318124 [Ascobolus immersus RN42]|uniref:PQ loop repeat protein n=1 Tax=Ascobolus immersus RN42 TaxID=1160509 RepID=A0A3N4I7T4_ASCIM|nr:hypothetical protein BJ508DRAFT_318124 [Ascobolus immersus RN42]